MARLETQGISLYYETFGSPDKPPVLLLAGLGGTGRSWGPLVERFARDYFVVLPDQRGTGLSTHADGGYTISQLGADMAALVEHQGVGAMHVAGTSTGGAIGQAMALDHPATVRSLTMASSFAHLDAFARREFLLRRKLMAESDPHTVYSCYALFLFSPQYTRDHPETVAGWIDYVAAQPAERGIALKRIDMILAHDIRPRLREIRQPTLVLCGDGDFCTPPAHSREIAEAIAGCEMVTIEGAGHFVHLEREEQFFAAMDAFLKRY